MIEDQFIHDTKGEPERDHITSIDCWCEPVRERWNALSQVWETWDRQTLTWGIRIGEVAPATGVATIVEKVAPPTLTAEQEQAERAALQAEDDFWKGVD